jgi:hypothetical protein
MEAFRHRRAGADTVTAALFLVSLLGLAACGRNDSNVVPGGAAAGVPPAMSGEGQGVRDSMPSVLEVGDMAPPFSLVGSDGRMYDLAQYRGRQTVVLAWFAKAFSEA